MAKKRRLDQQLSTTQKAVGSAVVLLGWHLLRGGKSAGTLHGLLYFANDRAAGYQKAAQESQHDPERRHYYQGSANQSQQFASTLNDSLHHLGSQRLTSTASRSKPISSSSDWLRSPGRSIAFLQCPLRVARLPPAAGILASA